MKIFGIGINKTGTQSLSDFIGKLGFRTLHDRIRAKSIQAAINGSKRFIPHLKDHDAFFDFPENLDLEKLLERFPDARFIMTTRDTEQWVTSRIIHVLHNRTVTNKSWRDINTEVWRQQKNEHENLVRETFTRLGKLDQLLIVDVCSNPEKAAFEIARFLGVERKKVDFPRRNTGESKLQQIIAKFKGPSPPTFAGNKGPLIIEEPEPPKESWIDTTLRPVLQQVRESSVRYWELILSFCKSIRFQSPIVLNRKT